MDKKFTPQQEEKLRQLINEHNTLCEKFEERIHYIMDEIDSICTPAGITAYRVISYKRGKEVTIIDLQNLSDMDNEEEIAWLKDICGEDR